MPGGVCAVLDYEVEMMADYVSEMATRIVLPQSTVNVAFRKFVSQILTSTRLPSTTILLGMNYLSKRTNEIHRHGQIHHSEGEVWRMLTIALLLGSKFLDDNTFQNKSWAEVSGIPVRELNTLEYEWLTAIDWAIFVNLDESKDYQAWLDNWKTWVDTKKYQQAQARANRERLAPILSPIDTDIGRTRGAGSYQWHQQQVAEYERYSNMKRNPAPAASTYRREPQPAWNPYQGLWTQAAAPLTPPDSCSGTPEYFSSATSATPHYPEWFDRSSVGNTNGQRYQPLPYNTFQQGRQSHTTRNAVTHPAIWNSHASIWDYPAECACPNCVPHKPVNHFMAPVYGQTVVN